MFSRRSLNKGFTLSELLVSVAITAILVLIAVPSIFSIQDNMRMVELNSAAQSISQAAQAKMTSLKTNGTWYSTIEKAGFDKDDFQKAQNLPSSTDSDTYYLSAGQARSLGIINSSSVDSTVYNGDFIIEFSKQTASVCGVFYADGKQGLFGTQPPLSENYYAQSYYLGMSSAAGRDAEARKDNSPLIGYFWGTPAGATKTIALENPIIYADEDGNVCIQNTNLEHSALNTSLDVIISRVNADGSEGPSFVLSGIQVFGGQILAYEITTQERLDAKQTGILVSAGEGIDLISRGESIQTDVFNIDLNMISDLVHYTDSGADDIKAILEAFGPAENLRVDAKVSTNQVPCVPSSATSYLQWLGRLITLSYLVTDPSHLKLDDSYDGTHIDKTRYNAPKVELGFVDGTSSADTAYITKLATSFDLSSTQDALKTANPASAYQSYSGGRFKLSSIDASISTLNASLGSYNNHRYQTFEIWLNDVEVGYLHNNTWVWTPGLGEAFGACVTNLNTNDDTLTLESLRIDVRAFAQLVESGIVSRSDGDYIVYIRTTPRIDEVSAYFTNQINTQSSIHNLAQGNTGARGSNLAQTTGIRSDFEREFGAPSSASLWMVARQTASSGIAGFPLGSNNDFRVYYAGTPALGFTDHDSSSLRDKNGVKVTDYDTSELRNASMWYYERSGSSYIAHSQAMVIHPNREGVDSLHLTTAYASDFEIPFSSDSLFTRVLFYNGEDGQLINAQYVPYSVQNDARYATIANRPYDKPGYVFEWITPSTYPAGRSLALAEGGLVDSYSSQLSYGRVDVKATYTERNDAIGLIYYENYQDGTRGVYGYTGYESPLINTLRGNEVGIIEWGYYAIVDQSIPYTDLRQGGLYGRALNLAHNSFEVAGENYRAYDLHAPNDLRQQSFSNIAFCLKQGNTAINPSYYSFNVNFAQMVEKDAPTVAQWGTEAAPFIVRHAQHFVGTMPEKWVQEKYLAMAFAQTHSIDLAGQHVSYGNKQFTGSYEGGNKNGCVIENYTPETANYSHYSVGLFGIIGGGKLQNVTIDYTKKRDTFVHSFSSGDDFAFGFLGSIAHSDAEITNCRVDGLRNDGQHLKMNISAADYSRLSVGGIVGRAEGVIITDCKVQGIDIQITSTLAAHSSYLRSIGGIVGFVEGSKNKILRSAPENPSDPPKKAVTDFSITGASNQSLANASLYFGAIVGYKHSNATNISLDNTWFASTSIKRTISGSVYTYVEAIGRVPTGADPVG
ncbi:MAG: pilus assembly FimT family protein [Raoultibacter sp.]